MNYKVRSKIQSYSTDADQAELNALLDANASIDSSIEDEKIAGTIYDELEDEIPLDEEEWMREDQGKDMLVGHIAEHIEWRSETLGDYYPFIYKDNHLMLKENPSLAYLFCLCVSLIANLTSENNTRLPRFFEKMAAKLFTKFFSAHAKFMHTGWPRSEGTPKQFQEMVTQLQQSISPTTKEWSWCVERGFNDEDAIYIKDCGVDFVSWIDFLDNRDGRLFALGQCACGNDWPTKFGDIDIEKLKLWFHPHTYTKCVKVFSTPYLLVDEMIREASFKAGITFDRIRLTIAYEKFKPDFIDMQNELIELIEFCKKIKRAP